jgi:hypothetical protein
MARANTIKRVLSESWTSLAIASVILGSSFLRRRDLRCIITIGALAALLVAMLRLPLHVSIPEGDYRNFVEDRSHFNNYMVEQVNFQYHLSSQLVRGFDAALGSTDSSMVPAFHWLSRLFALIFVGCLLGLGFLERWSERVVRYLALAVAVPTAALFYGYHEFGYLPAALEATAIPLGLIALERHRWGLLAASSAMLGVGAALHGFGLVALAFMLLVSVVYVVRDQEVVTVSGLLRTGNAAVYGIAGWVGWVPFYAIVLHSNLAASHAAEFPLRPLFHPKPYPSYHRIAQPLFSSHGLRELGYEFLIVGVITLVLLVFAAGGLRLPVALAAIPVLLFVAVFWPVQGLGEDTDFLASAFPPLFAVAWLVAPSRRLTVVALAMLAGGEWALHHVLTPAFIDEGGEI